jgi:nucleotide-binding universal stress UspA family protein
MYAHILIPVAFDTDETPEAALRVAARLVAAGGKVTLLHVMQDAPRYAQAYLPPGWSGNVEATLASELGRWAAVFGPPDTAVLIRHGHPAREILDFAEAEGVDCIVIAGHRPGLRDRLLGGVASKVVQRAPCAVHVMR